MWLLFKKRRLHRRLVRWLRAKGCVVNEYCREYFSDPEIVACINGTYMAVKLGKNSDKIHISRYLWREKVLKSGGKVAFVTSDNFEKFKTRVRMMLQKPSLNEEFGYAV